MDNIKQTIESVFYINDISEKNRTIKYIIARGLYIKILSEKGISIKTICDNVKLDNSTVRNSMKKFDGLIDSYPEYKSFIQEVYAVIQNEFALSNQIEIKLDEIDEIIKSSEKLFDPDKSPDDYKLNKLDALRRVLIQAEYKLSNYKESLREAE